MGVFSSKKIVVVASVAYNLAGDLEERTNYLKTLVTWNTLSGTKESMGETIINGYKSGPGMQLRRFFNWTQMVGHYDQVGLPTGRILRSIKLTSADVSNHIPRRTGEEVWVHRALIDNADYSYWCERWILENRPEDVDTDWSAEFNPTTGNVDIQFEDNSTASFRPQNFNARSQYVYVYYQTIDTTGPQHTYGPLTLWIYRIGSGFPELDDLVEEGTDYNEFFPYIPIRLQNEFLSDSFMPDAYAQVKKAYKKATGSKLEELTDIIGENESIDDIDNTYVVFGVPLNAMEPACCRYMFRFFEKLQQTQIGGPTAYQDWIDENSSQQQNQENWEEWYNGSHDPESEPTRPTYTVLPDNKVEIKAEGEIDSEYLVRLKWAFINSGSGAGLAKPGAKSNECWAEFTGTEVFSRFIHVPGSNYDTRSIPAVVQKFRVYWQRDALNYDYIDVFGMTHENVVHGGKAVIITPEEAFDEAEESSFLIPLHYETWRQMSLADSTQMANECMFAVFNCYEIHKQRWWQRGIFRIIFVIVIAIISVLLTGGLGIGLLGAHLSLGVSLGFTGMMAAIVGSVINALAALVLSMVLDLVTSSLGVFGEILSAIISFLIGNLGDLLKNGLESLVLNFGSLLRVDRLIQLTNAIGGGIIAYLRNEAIQLGIEMEDYLKWAERETKKIQEEYFEEFGYGGGRIDPLMFVDSAEPVIESSDTFLTRTLMTGGDIAEMSHEMISNFVDLSLNLPDAHT